MVGAGAESRLRVADAAQERLAQPGQQVIGEGRARLRQADQLPRPTRLCLVRADHVEIEAGQPASVRQLRVILARPRATADSER